MSNGRPPIGPVPRIGGEPAMSISPQQKRLIVHEQTHQLCIAWMHSGQDRPTVQEVQDFLTATTETIRESLGWN